MRFFKKTNIDFMGKRKTWYMVSLCVILVGLISIPLKGGLDFGLDFTGGTELVVEFTAVPEISAVRDMMTKAGFQKNEIKVPSTGVVLRWHPHREGAPGWDS